MVCQKVARLPQYLRWEQNQIRMFTERSSVNKREAFHGIKGVKSFLSMYILQTNFVLCTML